MTAPRQSGQQGVRIGMKRVVMTTCLLIGFASSIFAYDFFKIPFGFESATSIQDAARLQAENQISEYFELFFFLKIYGYDVGAIQISIETGFSNDGRIGSIEYEFSTKDENIIFDNLLVAALYETIRANDLPLDVLNFVDDGLPGGARRGFIDPKSKDLPIAFFHYDYNPKEDTNKFSLVVPHDAIYNDDYYLLTRVWKAK